MPHDVFISYSSQDKPVAEAICAGLEGQGIRCWIAPRDIAPSMDYAEALIDAIEASHLFLLILSSYSNTSRQVRTELERAFSKDIPILPVRIEDVALSKSVEYFVSGSQWFDALAPPIGDHVEKLAAAIRGLQPPAEAPALVAATTTEKPGSPPQNLPRELTSLVGREREIAAVTERLLAPEVRLLTLTGAGGTGKTRLGIETASRVLGQFRDGVFFVALAPVRDPDLVVPTIAQTLGLREEGAKPLDELLKEHLRDKQMLLLVDNFEQVVAGAPRVRDVLINAPQTKMLVTSREALRVRGENLYPVPPLTLPDPQGIVPIAELAGSEAVRLFVERAKSVKPDFALTEENADAVVEICCRRLEGLPLAIELAAARVALYSPQALVERMESRLKVLTGGARDLPERQRTMRNAIAWSYDLLEEPEKRLFGRLSVFRGGCTLEAAEAVCAAGGALGIDVAEGLESLIGKSLLRQAQVDGEPRFVLLETIREYGKECLKNARELDAMHSQHAAFFLDFAESAFSPSLLGADAVKWLERIEREHDNLRAALQWAVDAQDVDQGLRLVRSLNHFWIIRGYATQGRAWLERILAGSSGKPSPLRARALYGGGYMALRQGDMASARLIAERSLTEFRELLAQGIGDPVGNRRGFGRALCLLGETLVELGERAEGRTRLEEGLAIVRETGDSRYLGVPLLWLGAAAGLDRDTALARHYNDEARMAFEKVGDVAGVANALMNLGVVAWLEGDLNLMRTLCSEGLAICRELGDRQTGGWLIGLMGRAAYAKKHLQRYARLQGASEAVLEAIGVRMWPMEGALLGGSRDVGRQEMGEEAFAAACAEGRQMSFGQAIAYALEGD